MSEQNNQKPISLFYSYSHRDEKLRDALTKHLALLKRQGLIKEWHDRQINPGEEWMKSIDEHLKNADIILLLVSMDFIASDYCYEQEMKLALKRHNQGSALVIPIIVRPVVWNSAPFGHLQSLPKDGKPITTWRNRDSAWVNVVEGISKMVTDFLTNRRVPQAQQHNVISKRQISNFGLLLRNYRNVRHISQLGLERLLMKNDYLITNGLISKYEYGLRNPPPNFIQAIVKVLNLRQEEISALVDAHFADVQLRFWRGYQDSSI